MFAGVSFCKIDFGHTAIKIRQIITGKIANHIQGQQLLRIQIPKQNPLLLITSHVPNMGETLLI
jgi:hypothetical protein